MSVQKSYYWIDIKVKFTLKKTFPMKTDENYSEKK
jgi:hypothetical protein